MYVRCVNCTSYFGHVRNFRQYLYFSVFSKHWMCPTLSFCCSHCIQLFLYFLEDKNSCFVTKKLFKTSYILLCKKHLGFSKSRYSLKKKSRQSKMKTSFSYDRSIKLKEKQNQVVHDVFWKRESEKEDFKKRKTHSYMKHYVKVWRLLFDACLSHLEKE